MERGASAPVAIAKLRLHRDGDSQTLTEADALDEVGEKARAAGAVLPRRLAVGTVGSRIVLLESAVPGRVAALALQSRPAQLERVLERLVDWLARWHELTAHTTVLAPADLERHLLRPAAALGEHVPNGRRYTSWLEQRCEAADNGSMPLVAVHNDLTMWNVALTGDARVGVVDWEAAQPSGLPLGDFAYAVVDAVAATRGYRDRLWAFEQCFAPAGAHTATVARLRARLCDALGLSRDQAELCFHAVWLRQTVDPRRLERASDRKDFLHILARVADDAIGPRLLEVT
jgi:hypothetical protein